MALHDFRRAAATFLAMDTPEKVGLTPGILQHAGPDVADRHYNLSRGMQASRRHAQTMSSDPGSAAVRDLNQRGRSMRAVIYARYSSDNQREASIDDQVEVCRRYIQAQGWQLANVFADRAVSGASRHRVAYQQMIADAEQRSFDIIVCEALDRVRAEAFRRGRLP